MHPWTTSFHTKIIKRFGLKSVQWVIQSNAMQLSFFFFFCKAPMNWLGVKRKPKLLVIKAPTHIELRSFLFLFRTGTGSLKQPPDKVSEPCKKKKTQSDTTWESNVPALSLSLSEPMLDWDLLFSWLELADLFWVHNLSCSLFLGFRFSLSSHASASWPVLSSSSQAPSPWRLSPKILYTAAPGLNPLLKILGKSRLTTLQEASTRLSKAAMQKKNQPPRTVTS